MTGSNIFAKFIDQTTLNSDHDFIRWEVNFKVAKKPQKLVLLNKKLAKEINESAVLDHKVQNSVELLKKFLYLRKLKKKASWQKEKQPATLAGEKKQHVAMPDGVSMMYPSND